MMIDTHFLYCQLSPFYLTFHCQYADELLCFFVHEFGKLYCKDMFDYNVHGLVHLAQYVRQFGPLESFSAFTFEIFMGRIRKDFVAILSRSNHRVAGLLGVHTCLR